AEPRRRMDLPNGRNFEQTQLALILSRTPDTGKSPWKSRLLGGGKPTCGPLPATTGLGFTRLFFPLFQPMFRMGGQPAIWQEGFQGSRITWSDCRNPTQH